MAEALVTEDPLDGRQCIQQDRTSSAMASAVHGCQLNLCEVGPPGTGLGGHPLFQMNSGIWREIEALI